MHTRALNCGLRELDDILLLDIVEGLPQGEAMDINHQLSERGSDCMCRGSNDYEDMTGSENRRTGCRYGKKTRND